MQSKYLLHTYDVIKRYYSHSRAVSSTCAKRCTQCLSVVTSTLGGLSFNCCMIQSDHNNVLCTLIQLTCYMMQSDLNNVLCMKMLPDKSRVPYVNTMRVELICYV
jgi:hypothetical protein